MRMSLIQKLNAANPKYHIELRSSDPVDSRLLATAQTNLSHLVFSQDTANFDTIEHAASEFSSQLFRHDYRHVIELYPFVKSLADARPEEAHVLVSDFSSTLDHLRAQYVERYSPVVKTALSAQQNSEFSFRNFIRGCLAEDVDVLIREGLTGETLCSLYPTCEGYLVSKFKADFERLCSEYDSTQDKNKLKSALAILVAVDASV